MKKLIAIFLFVAAFTGCNTTASNSPKSAVASFVEAARNGNIDDLKKYLTSEDVAMMSMGENFLAKLDPAKAKEMKEQMSKQFRDKTKDASIDIKDEKIDGDNAVVNVNFTHNGTTDSHPFSLKKEEGVWKISLLSTGMSTSDMSKEKMEEGMKQMEEGMKNLDGLSDSLNKGMDELKKLDNDSLKKLLENNKASLQKLKEALKNDK